VRGTIVPADQRLECTAHAGAGVDECCLGREGIVAGICCQGFLQRQLVNHTLTFVLDVVQREANVVGEGVVEGEVHPGYVTLLDIDLKPLGSLRY
jgi:hypothetical protein